MKLLVQRFRSGLPVFWKKVRIYSLQIGAAFAAAWGINAAMNLGMPGWIIDICRYGLVICATIAGTSQFTTNNKELSEK